MSVAACAFASSIAREAPSLSAVIAAIASSRPAGAMDPRLSAVVRIPVPSAFVSTSASPGCAPALVTMRAGSTTPVTAMPYFGSASLMVWPPRIATPAARATLEPPSKMRAKISRSRSSGKATMFSALIGRPPIA